MILAAVFALLCSSMDVEYNKSSVQGRCMMFDGVKVPDPKMIEYFHAIGSQTACEDKCSENSACGGYSYSLYGNCINFLAQANQMIEGGEAWGETYCYLKIPKYIKSSVRGRCMMHDGTKVPDPEMIAYFHAIGSRTACEDKCSENSKCGGYSYSMFGNCINFLAQAKQMKGGGQAWGNTYCFLKDQPINCPDNCLTCREGGSYDGGVPLVNGVCTDWCSWPQPVDGYCGTTPIYQNHGTDCRLCYGPWYPSSAQPEDKSEMVQRLKDKMIKVIEEFKGRAISEQW